MTTAWIVCDDATHPEHPYAIHCRRCGAMRTVAVPINLDDYIRLANEFQAQHEECSQNHENHGNQTNHGSDGKGK